MKLGYAARVFTKLNGVVVSASLVAQTASAFDA